MAQVEKAMDIQMFYNKLCNAKEIIENTFMICEAMDWARGQLDGKGLEKLYTGINGVLAHIMGEVCRKLDEMDEDFRAATGAKWPCEMDDKEKAAWAIERGRRL